MNWKLFGTMAALIGVGASVALGQGTTPTILEGNYISNVFGQSNFIKNPNAKLNTKDVTVSSAVVSQSKTSPLVASSKFLVTFSAGGTVTWATRSFDAGMKNQNCEARFTYKGFLATSKAQVKQGANVVAELALSPTGTDPRIASINFPCGDLSASTTFVLTDSAVNSGTNEIGGIYVGLATNQANVAQASKIGGWDSFLCGGEPSLTTGTAVWSAPNVAGSCSGTPVGLASAALSNLNTLTFGFSNLPPGEYVFMIPAYVYPGTVTSGTARCDGRIKETTLSLLDNGNSFGFSSTTSSFSTGQITQFKFQNTVTANRIFQIELNRTNGLGNCNAGTLNFAQNVSLYRFPTSSELVVTPERQNTFAGIKGVATANTNSVTTNAWTKLTAGSTLTRTSYGKAKVESNNDYSITIENLPVGSYYVTTTAFYASLSAGSGDQTSCFFGLADTATGGAQIGSLQVNATGDATLTAQTGAGSTIGGVYTNTSVANRTFFVQAYRSNGSGSCLSYSDSNRPVTISVIPLDQPSNSALYVQGPILGAQTGATIAAGYVGEVKRLSSGVVNVPSSNNWFSVGSGITLTAGVWSCSASLAFNRNGATFTSTGNLIQAFSETTTGPTYHWERQGIGRSADALPTSFTTFNVGIRPIIFSSNGTQLTWPDGVTRGTNVLYTVGFIGVYTAGTPQYISETECVRIN
jgi:hypothetical protein